MRRQSRTGGKFGEQLPHLTDKERFLIGWPGYRTHPEKSGLAPVETQAELAHMQGLMLRWLLTGRFRTRNPIYLGFMICIGLGLSLLLFPIITALSGGEDVFLCFLAPGLLPMLILGILLLFNAAKSIYGEQDWDDIAGDEE